MRKTSIFLILAAFFFAACSSGNGGSPESASTVESAGDPGSTAFANIEAANERAEEWNEDAQLYAVAAATPRLDTRGRSPGWFYTYVSESAGAVASVSVEGGEVAMEPAQELPGADISFLSENALPPAEELLDSSEAITESEEIGAVLEENPEARTAAGLDSVSGGEPVWLFSTIRGEERIEERVPAVSGG